MGLGFIYLAELAEDGLAVGVGGALQHQPHLGGDAGVVQRDHLAGGQHRGGRGSGAGAGVGVG